MPPSATGCMNPFSRLAVDTQLDVLSLLSRWELYTVQLSSHFFDFLIANHERMLPKLRLDTIEFLTITDRGGELLADSRGSRHDIGEMPYFEERVKEIEVCERE